MHNLIYMGNTGTRSCNFLSILYTTVCFICQIIKALYVLGLFSTLYVVK